MTTASDTPSAAEITVFEKSGGPLTKHIRLGPDGQIASDASACVMANGVARRASIDLNNMRALADLINNFRSNQAYALGRLKTGLPDHVRVVRADKLDGATDPAIIARTKEFLTFPDGEASLALLDADFKGMSEAATRRMEECGDLWCALCEVLPALETVACVERASTSSGLRNRETGQTFPGSGGRHIVVPVLDAADIPRFLSDLFDRCWLAGLGWGLVSAAGSFLERAIIDKAVGSPERLIFEGAPIIEPPLVQEGRAAVARDGFVLDTRSCPPLTDSERAELQKLKAAEEHRLLPERQRARALWSVEHIKRLVADGMPEAKARAKVDRWIDRGELSDTFPLPFDRPDLAGTTVAEVLADPERFVGARMADPFEGPAYGRGVAILYQRRSGSLFIKSFAHGGLTYKLKAGSRGKGDGAAPPDPKDEPEPPPSPKGEPPTAHIEVYEGLHHEAADRGLSALAAAKVPFFQRDRKLVNIVRVKAKAFGGDVIFVPGMGEVVAPIMLRALSKSAHWGKPDQRAKSGMRRIEPPKEVVQQILTMINEWPFPPLRGLIGCPTLRPDGSLLTATGYDPATGYVLDYDFPMPPIPERPNRADAVAALALFTDLLREFPFRKDGTSLAVAYSAMMTPVLRPAMEVAPLHVGNAPQSGTGKSFLWDVASTVATGERCAAISLTGNEDEDEKRLASLALAGVPIIGIDNVTCPVSGDFLCQLVERPTVRPRKLGGNEVPVLPNSFCCFLNGNNVEIYADMVRRTVMTHIDANMEDPELRKFKQNPLALIRADRGKYVAAALTIARAYTAAGKPGRLPPLASYDHWSDIVRSALVWLGCADPVDSMVETRSIDPVRAARAAIFAAWASNQALHRARVLTADIVKATQSDLELRDAVLRVAEDRKNPGQVSSVMLAKWLAQNQNNVANKKKLVRETEIGGRRVYWKLWDVED